MTPAAEYKRALGDLDTIVKRIPMVVNDHAARQEKTPTYWTHVADLKKARVDLLQTLAFLGDLESREMLHAEGVER